MNDRAVTTVGLLAGVLAGALSLLATAPAWTATGNEGRDGPDIRISGLVNEPGLLAFVLVPAGAAGAVGSVGLDPDSVRLQFRPSAGGAVELTDVQVRATAGRPDVVRQTAILAVDTSSSLGEAGMAAVRDAASAFLEAAPPTVEVGLVTFGSPAEVRQEPTTDRVAVQSAVDALRPDGQTALYDATIAAVNLLDGEGVERILLLTDGRDEDADGNPGSAATLDEAVVAVSTSGATLTAVGFGSEASGDALQSLADAGRGQVVDAAGAVDLSDTFEFAGADIARDLLVTADVPGTVAGRRGTLVVSAQAGPDTVYESAFLTPSGGDAPSSRPAEPTEIAVAIPLVDTPAAVRAAPGALLWTGLVVLVLSLLAVPVVAVTLLARRRSPEAMRRRSLAVYTMHGRAAEPAVLIRTPRTRLGNNAVTRSAVRLADRVVGSRGSGARIARSLEAADVPLRAAEWLVLRVAAPAVAAPGLLLVSRGDPLIAFVGFLVAVAVPPVVLEARERRRKRAFLAMLPDTLVLMANGLRAGYSMPQALDSVVRDGRDPVRAEFRRAVVEARLGVPPEAAMEHIADRMDSQDFTWVVMAIRIQGEVGGNLAELLETVSTTLRDRDRLRRLVSTLSAEGRLSAWILGLLPVAFVLYMLLVQPSYLSPLVTEPLGVLLLTTGLVVFGIGVWGLRWATRVKV